jgi:NAD-dependent dihydropyrimidine dehydrogenase PreA subunit
MTYIVTEPCIGTKDRACVEVCPVECFYEGTDQLYIHPEECIDCAACEPVCPVTAIFPEDSVPEQYKSYTPKNYKFIEEYPDAPHALTKAMLGAQDNFATTLTMDGKTVTFPPPPSGFGGPAAPAPKAEVAPAPAAQAAPPPAPAAAPAPQAAAPAPAPAPRTVVTAGGDVVAQMAEAVAAAAEAAARAAEAAAAAVRMLQGKADGRTGSGAPSAPAVQPQVAPTAKPAEAKAAPKAEAPAAQRQAVAPDPSFERAKEVLYALTDFESGARTADEQDLAQAEETATTVLDEIATAVGKRDYTLEVLEKKDVALRQKMELANAILDRVARLRLNVEIRRQRGRTRAQLPGVLVAFAIAGACSVLGLVYALKYGLPTVGTPTLHDMLNAPFSPEGFMPFLGFNLLAGLFALFGLMALLKVGQSWVEECHLEALRPKEFGAASLRPRRGSWVYRLKFESPRILEAKRMMRALAAKKR